MLSIFKYDTQDEKDSIIAQQTANGMELAEIQNISEGNFLAFVDVRPPVQVVDNTPVVLKDIRDAQDIILLKQEGIL